MTPTTWMGGSRPRPLLELTKGERTYVSYLFRQQVSAWLDFWFAPTPLDVARIFWKRARYNAHATYRDQGE